MITIKSNKYCYHFRNIESMREAHKFIGEKLQQLKTETNKIIIIVGSQGSGKTILAKQIAGDSYLSTSISAVMGNRRYMCHVEESTLVIEDVDFNNRDYADFIKRLDTDDLLAVNKKGCNLTVVKRPKIIITTYNLSSGFSRGRFKVIEIK